MKFHWLNTQGVECDGVFILQGMHRHYYHYIEGDRTLQVVVEPCRDQSGRYFEEIADSSFLTWLPPHQQQTLLDEDRARIRANVSAALQFMEIDHRFVQL
jgi:hypothetical protein